MRFIIDCFIALWNCTPAAPSGPHPAPEINATGALPAVALILCMGVIMWRQYAR